MNKPKLKQPETKTSAIITLPPPERSAIIKDVETLSARVGAFKITDPETRAGATNLLLLIKNKYKDIEAKKTAIVKPIKDSVKLIEAEFNILLKPLAGLEGTVKAEIARDFLEQEAEQKKARAKAEAEAQKKLEGKRLQEKLNSENAIERELAEQKAEQIRQEVLIKAPDVSRSNTAGAGTASIRKIWKYEVTDFSKLPDGFKTVDSGAIREAIREGLREIAGLRIYEDISVAGGNKF